MQNYNKSRFLQKDTHICFVLTLIFSTFAANIVN